MPPTTVNLGNFGVKFGFGGKETGFLSIFIVINPDFSKKPGFCLFVADVDVLSPTSAKFGLIWERIGVYPEIISPLTAAAIRHQVWQIARFLARLSRFQRYRLNPHR